MAEDEPKRRGRPRKENILPETQPEQEVATPQEPIEPFETVVARYHKALYKEGAQQAYDLLAEVESLGFRNKLPVSQVFEWGLTLATEGVEESASDEVVKGMFNNKILGYKAALESLQKPSKSGPSQTSAMNMTSAKG